MTLRTPENAERIFDMLDRGVSVRKVAQAIGVTETAIRKWAREDEAFGSQYASLRDAYHEAEADALIELADAAREDEPSLVNAYRLAIDTRKWVLSKVLPKKYGDKVTNEHTGPDGKELTIVIQRFTPEREEIS